MIIRAAKSLLSHAVRLSGAEIVPNWKAHVIPIRDQVRQVLRDNSVDLVVDVGAHEGGYINFLRSIVGYTGRIISFDPIESNVQILRELATKDGKLTVHQVALGSSSSNVKFNIANQTAYSSILQPDKPLIASMGVPHMPDAATTSKIVDVEVKRLDSFANELSSENIFLKMDTQGYDLNVFRGASAILPKVVALQSEVAFKTIYEGAPNYHTILKEFNEAGYEEAGFYSVNKTDAGTLIEADCILVKVR